MEKSHDSLKMIVSVNFYGTFYPIQIISFWPAKIEFNAGGLHTDFPFLIREPQCIGKLGAEGFELFNTFQFTENHHYNFAAGSHIPPQTHFVKGFVNTIKKFNCGLRHGFELTEWGDCNESVGLQGGEIGGTIGGDRRERERYDNGAKRTGRNHPFPKGLLVIEGVLGEYRG